MCGSHKAGWRLKSPFLRQRPATSPLPPLGHYTFQRYTFKSSCISKDFCISFLSPKIFPQSFPSLELKFQHHYSSWLGHIFLHNFPSLLWKATIRPRRDFCTMVHYKIPRNRSSGLHLSHFNQFQVMMHHFLFCILYVKNFFLLGDAAFQHFRYIGDV